MVIKKATNNLYDSNTQKTSNQCFMDNSHPLKNIFVYKYSLINLTLQQILKQMQVNIEQKKNNLNVLTDSVNKQRKYLLQMIRTNESCFNQFIAHVGQTQTQKFLQKNIPYKNAKNQVEKLKEQIQNQMMLKRRNQLQLLGIPQNLKRALTSPICAICIEKHNWISIVILECGHTFHGKCVKKLRDNKCPQCRSVINLPNQRQNIFGYHADQY